jgi:hypothetical protein
MWFRTSDSGNGSFTDQFCDFSGGCGATSKSIVYYRTKRWNNTYSGAVFEGEKYAKRIDSILGKKFTVDELPDHFDVEFPCSYIRKIDGLNYPDVKCSGWRWSYGNPYVSNKYDLHGRPDRNNLKVYVENLSMHVYLTKDEIEFIEGEEYVSVDFSREYDKNPNQFCRIGQWADSKKEDPNGVIKWKILKIIKPKGEKPYFELGAMVNDRVQFKKESDGFNLYKITKIINY